MSFIHLECWPEHQSVMLAVFKHVNNFFSLISKCIYHKQIWNTSLKQAGRDFAGGLAIKTSCFYCRGAGVGGGKQAGFQVIQLYIPPESTSLRKCKWIRMTIMTLGEMKSPGFKSQSYVLPARHLEIVSSCLLTLIAWVQWTFTHSHSSIQKSSNHTHAIFDFSKLTSQNISLISSQGCPENLMDLKDMHELHINAAKEGTVLKIAWLVKNAPCKAC